MSRILVTPRSLTAKPGDSLAALAAAGFEVVLAPAGRQPSEDELVALVRGCTGWLAGVEPITARVLDAATDLRVISRNGTGIDSIDLAAASARGVRVMTAGGANARAVAELTLALMLAGLRNLAESAAGMKDGQWVRREGRELSAATVGLVGCGAIGRRVAGMLSGFGTAIRAYDVKPDPGFRPAGDFAWADLDMLAAESTIVSFHCPAEPGAPPLFDAGRLARLPRGAGIVNTARASLIDEAALLAALDDGAVGWYATDVFAVEPPGRTPLVAHPRVVAVPHIGAYTAEGGREAIRVAVDNLIAALGEPTG
jgi:D-3-phosphoglycerate dehydrogenase